MKLGFEVVVEDKSNAESGFRQTLAARSKTTLGNVIRGKAGEVLVTVGGARGNFYVELDEKGILGKNLEWGLWSQIVHVVDPSLWVCKFDGMVFETKGKYDDHIRLHDVASLSIENDIAFSDNNPW